MLLKVALALTLGLATLCAQAAPPSELDVRHEVSLQADNLLRKEDFAGLEKLLVSLRTNRERSPSGTWKYAYAAGTVSSRLTRMKDADGGRADALALVERWKRAQPKSTLASILEAQLQAYQGYDFRGEGLAKEVKPEAWSRFNAYVEQARQTLEQSKPWAAVDPEWYVGMAFIAKLQGWSADEFNKLMDEAVRREPAYHMTYFRAVEFHSPMWGGSKDAQDAFARWATKSAGPVEGPAMYARIYWYLAQVDYKQNTLFMGSKADWPTLSKSFEAMLAKYPEPWNLNHYAKFACLAKDREVTRRLFEQIGSTPVPEAWQSEAPRLFSGCREAVAGIRNPALEGAAGRQDAVLETLPAPRR